MLVEFLVGTDCGDEMTYKNLIAFLSWLFHVVFNISISARVRVTRIHAPCKVVAPDLSTRNEGDLGMQHNLSVVDLYAVKSDTVL
jgi:hypothetical protein